MSSYPATIKCSKETQSRLKKVGEMGDSYDKAIVKLLDRAEKNEI